MRPRQGTESCQKHLQAPEEWVLPVTSIKEPEEGEFVVDSEANIHMVSKKNLELC